MLQYTKDLIFILLLSDFTFSKWILDFSEEFDQNSTNLTLWTKQNLEIGKLSLIFKNFDS
jgi:hypothetical protein